MKNASDATTNQVMTVRVIPMPKGATMTFDIFGSGRTQSFPTRARSSLNTRRSFSLILSEREREYIARRKRSTRSSSCEGTPGGMRKSIARRRIARGGGSEMRPGKRLVYETQVCIAVGLRIAHRILVQRESAAERFFGKVTERLEDAGDGHELYRRPHIGFGDEPLPGMREDLEQRIIRLLPS